MCSEKLSANGYWYRMLMATGAQETFRPTPPPLAALCIRNATLDLMFSHYCRERMGMGMGMGIRRALVRRALVLSQQPPLFRPYPRHNNNECHQHHPLSFFPLSPLYHSLRKKHRTQPGWRDV